MLDEMGCGEKLTLRNQLYTIDGLANHPSSLIEFALINQEIVGVIIGFINFSTFKAKPFVNIHDFVVFKDFRGKGIGRKLLDHCIAISTEKKYCKITLEVRTDNTNAQILYINSGFNECKPKMHFWTKDIM